MSCCERCWSDAYSNPETYRKLLELRKGTPCTPEEQAGQFANECPWCGRKTLHQHTGEPMCGCPRSPRAAYPSHAAPAQTAQEGKL